MRRAAERFAERCAASEPAKAERFSLAVGRARMAVRRKILNQGFASVSPVFVTAGIAVLLACGNPGAAVASASNRGASTADSSTNASVKKEAAATQFARAEEQRSILNGKAPEKRTLAEYKQAVASYRRVYLITPRAPEVADSLLCVAELYTEMGDRFGRSYYQSAVDSYQFLIREYPKSKYTQDAMLRVGKLQREHLGDSDSAAKTYTDFLKKYPHSPKKREAQEALAELALLQRGDVDSSTSGASANNSAPAPEPAGPPAALAPAPAVRATKEESSADANAEPTPGTVSGGAEAVGRNSTEGPPRIRRITTSVNTDETRVIIDLEDTVRYTSARIKNPDRIFFDLHMARLTPEVARGNIQVSGDLLTAVRVAQNHAGVVRVVLDVYGVKDYGATLSGNPTQLVISLYANAQRSAPPLRAGKTKNAKPRSETDSSTEEARASDADSGNVKTVSTNAKPDLVRPATTPQPTRDGQSTLTRALGLKIGRIVIDPGHGGHDTGTIGPTGLMEKDLCLDVALRLGKIIQQKLPGADIVYTRSDDTFIPLEERTKIANDAKADLFISIHANSSRNQSARGVETYYLNLKGSAEAMEVAARENASSDQGIHDLQDLVTKIARNEKIDESKEFAEDIQDSLAKRMKASKSGKDRGVRKAPFVVLIGADMPSILTEISFLSNPADEKLLKQPEYRQKVAEGLYQGVASYLQSMNSMTVNLPPKNGAAAGAAAAVEQSRNQR